MATVDEMTPATEYDPLMGGGADHDFDNSDRPKLELCPSGNFSAVCVLIWDLGTHLEVFKDDPNKKIPCRNIIIGWEVSKKKTDGTPHVILERYGLFKNGYQTFSSPLSKLRKLLEAWRGSKFSDDEIKAGVPIRKILGQPCMVAVNHRESKNKRGETVTYHEFGNVSPLPDEMTELTPVNPPTLWLTNDYPLLNGIPNIDWVPMWYGESIRDISYDSDEVKKFRAEAGEQSNAVQAEPEQPAPVAAQTATQPARRRAPAF